MRRRVAGVCAGLLTAGLLAGCASDVAGNAVAAPSARVQYTMSPQPVGGAQVTDAELAASADLLRSSAQRLGIERLRVEAGTGELTVTAPAAERERAYGLGESARLDLRPVLESMPLPMVAGGGAADRQSVDPAVQAQAMAAFDCGLAEELRGTDDPALPLIACDAEAETVYLLGPAFLGGQQVKSAQALFDSQREQNFVQLEFTDEASETWARFTGENLTKQAAFVLDSAVLSAPVIQGVTPAGSATSITGAFTLGEAEALAGQLSATKLPIPFIRSEMIEIPGD